MATQEPTTERLRALGQLVDGRPTSTEEFAEAECDEPWTYERVEGRLVVMSPEGTGHVLQSEPWRDHLGADRLTHPGVVQAIVSQAWIHHDEDNTRIADIGVYLGGPLEALNIPDQVPDLVFEFASPRKASRRRDYVEKRAQDERIGVREFVIVDRFDRRVTVLSLVGGRYVERVLTSAETYRTALLPGFEVDLVEVLAR